MSTERPQDRKQAQPQQSPRPQQLTPNANREGKQLGQGNLRNPQQHSQGQQRNPSNLSPRSGVSSQGQGISGRPSDPRDKR